MGFEATSSRNESRRQDAEGIDIISNFPFKIQCKDCANTPNYHKLLTETKAEVIFLRLRDNTPLEEDKRTNIKGDYVILSLNKFIDYVKRCHSITPPITITKGS